MFFSKPGGMTTYNRGNVILPDFEQGDLTSDDAFHDLDLSGIIPVGTKFVQLQVAITDPTFGKPIWFREKGLTGFVNAHKIQAMVLGIPIYARFWIGVDNNRILEYRIVLAGLIQLDITVVAWQK